MPFLLPLARQIATPLRRFAETNPNHTMVSRNRLVAAGMGANPPNGLSGLAASPQRNVATKHHRTRLAFLAAVFTFLQILFLVRASSRAEPGKAHTRWSVSIAPCGRGCQSASPACSPRCVSFIHSYFYSITCRLNVECVAFEQHEHLNQRHVDGHA